MKIIKSTKAIIKKYLNKIYPIYFYRKSYSQEGEDMTLARIFENKKEGFYVDVGAHHPTRFSNTYYFYLRGWRGINLDAMPGSMDLFNKLRPRDINLELAIGNNDKNLTYYIFDEPALNTFDNHIATKHKDNEQYQLLKQIKIQTNSLSKVLDMYLKPDTKIDFISIDVEGLDYAVLESNNWEKYTPNAVIVEDRGNLNLNEIYKSKIVSFMSKHNYILYSKLHLSLIFVKKHF